MTRADLDRLAHLAPRPDRPADPRRLLEGRALILKLLAVPPATLSRRQAHTLVALGLEIARGLDQSGLGSTTDSGGRLIDELLAYGRRRPADGASPPDALRSRLAWVEAERKTKLILDEVSAMDELTLMNGAERDRPALARRAGRRGGVTAVRHGGAGARRRHRGRRPRPHPPGPRAPGPVRGDPPPRPGGAGASPVLGAELLLEIGATAEAVVLLERSRLLALDAALTAEAVDEALHRRGHGDLAERRRVLTATLADVEARLDDAGGHEQRPDAAERAYRCRQELAQVAEHAERILGRRQPRGIDFPAVRRAAVDAPLLYLLAGEECGYAVVVTGEGPPRAEPLPSFTMFALEPVGTPQEEGVLGRVAAYRAAQEATGPDRDVRLLDGRAARRDVVATAMPRYEIVHFSCHGIAEAGNPLTGGLSWRTGG